MTDNLNEGIYMAALGMGLVFLTLIVFMIILLLLKKIFPEDDTTDTVDFQTSNHTELMDTPDQIDMSYTGLDRVLGSKIAAMAVSLYLAMEQDNVVNISNASGSIESSVWNKQSKNSFWNSQGSRPNSYGLRVYSPYDNKGIGSS